MFNYRILISVFLFIFITTATGFFRLDIDTDIVRSLPSEQKVISDALDIFANHPIHDQIAIDLYLNIDDKDILVACGEYVKERLHSSNLFSEVGKDKIANLIPELALHVVSNLPILFSQQELEQDIAPRLEKEFVESRFTNILRKLRSLEGIGQSKFIAADPLGFMEPVMAKLSLLAPLPNTSFYKGFVFSPDNRHLLVTARPNNTGTNTASARQISNLLDSITKTLITRYHPEGIRPFLTPVGAYRAALDNERIIRHDVNLALLLSTLGIGLLLFISFPRPLLGLFSLLPAVAGSATALFVFSLLHSSISIMVLGFGGALISITVDHGIAYLLFLDRRVKTQGKEASNEVKAIGILAVLTTCGAFLTLSFSGFPIFVELGQFAAMGVLFSFLFVHYIFPIVTPSMPASTRCNLPLQGFVNTLYGTGRNGFISAILLACVLGLFAKPGFDVSLNSMNTVSKDTLSADSLFSKIWGNIDKKVVLMVTGKAEEIQRQNDKILINIEADKRKQIISSAFVPSMIFPGKEVAARNREAWDNFWTDKRKESIIRQLNDSSQSFGFAKNGFSTFLKQIAPEDYVTNTTIPNRFYTLLGITVKKDNLTQFINVTQGKHYNSNVFYESYGNMGKIFDSHYFSKQLADILFKSFSTMLIIIVISAVVMLILFFASWQLTLITLLPPLFAYICTLGTMKLIGHSIDIPGLMLSIVILGMGIDYSIFFVRAHQRYRNPTHPSFTRIRMAVFMSGASTAIGFGVLSLAEHTLLRSIGITSLLGITYSIVGAFLLLPYVLQFYFKSTKSEDHTFTISERVRLRYRLMEAYPRMFARFKLLSDPMFADLPELLSNDRNRIKIILDVGCGYGVPGCWCLEFMKNAKLFGVDPDKERVRVAAIAMGNRGQILEDKAPDLPTLSDPPDLILLLDMLHYIDDKSIKVLFENCFSRINDNGILLIRYVIKPDAPPSWSWKLEHLRIEYSDKKAYYRSRKKVANLMIASGFNIETNVYSKTNKELIWLIGRAKKKRKK